MTRLTRNFGISTASVIVLTASYKVFNIEADKVQQETDLWKREGYHEARLDGDVSISTTNCSMVEPKLQPFR